MVQSVPRSHAPTHSPGAVQSPGYLVAVKPSVSIVIPTHNDEAWVAAALDSCLAQSHKSIEILCVDDASTDSTREIIEQYCARDPRIRLINHEVNSSAFTSRRTGVEAAAAQYVLFLDGDDELAPTAAEKSLALARRGDADVVGFGVDLTKADGKRNRVFEGELQPKHKSLTGTAILAKLFAPGKTAHGHIWGYLFKTELLRGVYADLPQDIHLKRANDLPVTFLALARASSYVSTPEHLYRYFFLRGRSGHRVRSMDEFEFYLEAVRSIEVIRDAVLEPATEWSDPDKVVACYESARLSVIAGVLRYGMGAVDDDLLQECLVALENRVGRIDVIGAAAGFVPEALGTISRISATTPEARSPRRHVLICTWQLTTGGVQGVVVSQARYLRQVGFDVSIVIFGLAESVYELPEEVRVFRVKGSTRAQRVSSWAEICRESGADVIFDHRVLYYREWPFYALAARSLGVPTIGFLQSFSLRPILDDNHNLSFLADNLPLLETVLVTSPTDVAYWKLRGIPDVVTLPTPPSPTLLEHTPRTEPIPAPDGTVELIWWGRLDQNLKQVRSLIPITAELRERGVDAVMTIIGPDSNNLTAAQLRRAAAKRGIADAVNVLGPLHGQALVDAVAHAHVYVFTSIIEGSPLSMVEAQAMGLPVAMYELPWLANLIGNDGVVTARQGDARGLARQIETLVNDPETYVARSRASLAAARRATDFDFPELYRQLLAREVPAEFSPEPTAADIRLILEWSTFYAERNADNHADALKKAESLRAQLDSLRAKVRALRNPVVAVRMGLGKVKRAAGHRLRRKSQA